MTNFNYKNLTPFKWFVLENFPFIESDFDEINNYHLFSKVVEYLNKTIDNMNLTGEQMENLTNAMTELQNYVNNYFDNLDVQEEINNKLDEMAEDGTFTRLIGNYVNSSVMPLINDLQSQINGLANLNPLVASSVSEMTDTSKIYVNTTDGNWYYYNGSAWTIGGVYQSTAIAENSIIPEMTNFILKENSINKWKPIKQNFNDVLISYDYNTYKTKINGNVSQTGRVLIQKEYLEAGTWSIKAFDYTGTKPPIYAYDETAYQNQDWYNPLATFGAGSYGININVANSGNIYFVAFFNTNNNPFNYEGKIILSKNSYQDVPIFIPIKYTFANFIDVNNSINDYWKNKNILFYGDSLTAWSTAPSLISNYFNMISTNKGIAGSTAGFIDDDNPVHTTNCGSSDTRLADLSNNNDVIVLMFGTNDYLRNVPLGNVPITFNINDTFDNTTFAGAMLKILHYLYTNNPNARIILMCPPWNHYQNVNNKTLRDYGDIVKEIGRLTITPVIDLMEELNANEINNTNYYTDGTHFNNYGYERVAELIKSKIEEFTPFEN